MTNQVGWVELPPPPTILAQPLAESLGLVKGLRAEINSHSFRCDTCHQMQPPNSTGVWVPDGVLSFDPSWSVEERARKFAYNGNFSMWCLGCAKKLSPKRSSETVKKTQGFFRKLLGLSSE